MGRILQLEGIIKETQIQGNPATWFILEPSNGQKTEPSIRHTIYDAAITLKKGLYVSALVEELPGHFTRVHTLQAFDKRDGEMVVNYNKDKISLPGLY